MSTRVQDLGGGSLSLRQFESLPKLVLLPEERCEEVCRLEPQCYPHPWSSELIRGEFKKEVSFRPALVIDEEIAAYSFNYLVVDELHILNIAVVPEFRGAGLGKLLLASLLRMAIGRGAGYATLEVRQSNLVAQRLYTALGFSLAGMRRHYYRDNGEHALVLERELGVENHPFLEQAIAEAGQRLEARAG